MTILILGLLWLVFVAGGAVVERALASATRHPWNAGLVSRTALGMVLWTILLFALATAGALRAPVIAACAAAVLVCGAACARSARSNAAPGDAAMSSMPPAALPVAAVVVAATLLLGLAASGPEVAWDADAYHLTVPRIWLEHGGFVRIPYNFLSYGPLALELLYAMAMAFASHVAAKLLHLGCAVLLMAAMVRHGARIARPLAGWIAAALFLACDVVRFEMMAAYVDLAAALFLFLAFAHVSRLLETGARADLAAAALLCGALAGVKLTGWIGVGAIVLLVLRDGIASRRGPGFSLAGALAVAAGALLLALPWFLRSYRMTGNPVYPLLYAHFGGPEWSGTLARRLAGWQRSIGMGRTLVDHLLLPWRVVMEGGPGYGRFDGRISRSFALLAPLSILAAPFDAAIRRALLAFSAFFVGWAASSQQLRLLIPALPFLCLASGLAVCRVLEAAGAMRSRRRAVTTGAVLALLCVPLLAWHPGAPGADADPIFAAIDRLVPRDGRIMFLNCNGGFFCHRDFIADTAFEASQMRELLAEASTPDDLDAVLARHRISHLLVRDWNWGIAYPASLATYLADPAHAVRIATSTGGYALYRRSGT